MGQGSAPTARSASRAEIDQALQALTTADYVRLDETAENRLARIGRCASHSRSANELVQEAVIRLLDGTRRWFPSKVTLVQFLVGAIWSIANEWARHFARNKSKPEYAVSESQLVHEDNEGNLFSPFNSLEATQLNPEERLIFEEDVAERKALADAIESHFGDDENATSVLLGWQEGMDGPAIQKEFGFSETIYRSIARRISRHSKKIRKERYGK